MSKQLPHTPININSITLKTSTGYVQVNSTDRYLNPDSNQEDMFSDAFEKYVYYEDDSIVIKGPKRVSLKSKKPGTIFNLLATLLNSSNMTNVGKKKEALQKLSKFILENYPEGEFFWEYKIYKTNKDKLLTVDDYNQVYGSNMSKETLSIAKKIVCDFIMMKKHCQQVDEIIKEIVEKNICKEIELKNSPKVKINLKNINLTSEVDSFFSLIEKYTSCSLEEIDSLLNTSTPTPIDQSHYVQLWLEDAIEVVNDLSDKSGFKNGFIKYEITKINSIGLALMLSARQANTINLPFMKENAGKLYLLKDAAFKEELHPSTRVIFELKDGAIQDITYHCTTQPTHQLNLTSSEHGQNLKRDLDAFEQLFSSVWQKHKLNNYFKSPSSPTNPSATAPRAKMKI